MPEQVIGWSYGIAVFIEYVRCYNWLLSLQVELTYSAVGQRAPLGQLTVFSSETQQRQGTAQPEGLVSLLGRYQL